MIRNFVALIFLVIPYTVYADLTLSDIALGMSAEHTKIQTGGFRAKGIARLVDEGSESNVEGPVAISLDFDHASGESYSVTSEPGFIYDSDRSKWNKSIKSVLLVKNNDAYYYSEAQRSAPWLAIRHRSSPAPDYTIKEILDVRGLGYSANSNLATQSKWGSQAFFSNANRDGEIQVENVTDGIARLSQMLFKGQVKYTVWINCSEGFTPVRAVVERLFPTGKQLEQEVSTSWIQKTNAWVPISYKSLEKTWYRPVNAQPDDSKLNERIFERELSFEWDYVNEAWNPEKFDVLKLPIPVGARILDERVTPPRFIGHSGVSSGVVHQEARNPFIIIAAVVSTLVLSLVIGIRFLRKR